MDCGNFEVKDEPAASRVVTNVVYAVLFVFLGSLIVSGPVRRLGSEETKFKESYADPQELPAPAVTLCELGVRFALEDSPVAVLQSSSDKNLYTIAGKGWRCRDTRPSTCHRPRMEVTGKTFPPHACSFFN